MLSLRPKCKECNDESWVKGLCYKHYKKDNLKKRNMSKLPKHIERRYNLLVAKHKMGGFGDEDWFVTQIKSFIATILEEQWKDAIKLFVK